jgi:osmotically-inducible protein OsmY
MAVAAALVGGNGAYLYASETDDRIESSAKKSYVYRTYLKDDDIKIECKDGAVTLTGTVSDESHKSLAADTVKGLPGVKSVDNRITVRGEAPSRPSDDWVSAKVKAALLFHRNVSAKTEVFVKDGIVTLRGTASSQAQKDLTTEYARDVEGVKDVKNEMTVVEGGSEKTIGETIDDASITAQVKAALVMHRSTSGLRTEVETNNGVVTLTGQAKNAAERDLVTKLVKDIKGVKDVRNNMTLAA